MAQSREKDQLLSNGERQAAIARRLREKLRSCLLQSFGVAALLAIDRALTSVDELSLSLHGDFTAILRELERTVSASLSQTSPVPPNAGTAWGHLIQHQSQVGRLLALQERLAEKRKLDQYRAELDSFTQEQRMLRAQAETAQRMEEKATAAQLWEIGQAARNLERQSTSETQIERKLQAKESLQQSSFSREMQRKREADYKEAISLQYRLDEARIRREAEVRLRTQHQKRAEVNAFNQQQTEQKAKERLREAELARAYSGSHLFHRDDYETRRKQVQLRQ